MFYGLSSLNRYHTTFAIPRWIAAIQLVPSLWFALLDASNLFSFKLPFVNNTVTLVMEGVAFALEILFLMSMLYAIRMLAESIELKKISFAAIRNIIFVGVHAALSIVADLPALKGIEQYLTLSRVLLELVMLVSIAWLLLSCAKNICREGDEEVTPRRSRFGWVNRMADTYEKTHNKLNEQARADGEAFMRRRREKQQNKRKKKKK